MRTKTLLTLLFLGIMMTGQAAGAFQTNWQASNYYSSYNNRDYDVRCVSVSNNGKTCSGPQVRSYSGDVAYVDQGSTPSDFCSDYPGITNNVEGYSTGYANNAAGNTLKHVIWNNGWTDYSDGSYDNWASDSDGYFNVFQSITCSLPNEAPTVDSFSIDNSPLEVGDSASFSAHSSDINNNIQFTEITVWFDGSQVYSDSKSTANPSWSNIYSISGEGTIEATVTVHDTNGATDSSTISETISDDNPVISSISQPGSSINTETVPVEFSTSSDNDDVTSETLSCTVSEDGTEKISGISIAEGGSYTGSYTTSGLGSHDMTVSCTEQTGTANTDSSTTSYSVDNLGPDQPTLQNPNDGEGGLDNNVNLEVSVTDPDGDAMNVSFYWDNGTEIATNTAVANGSSTSTTVSNLNWESVYQWYVEVSDGTVTTTSDTYTFSTSGKPDEPSLNNPADGASGLNNDVTLNVTVEDPEGYDMDVTFLWQNGTVIDTNTAVPNGTSTTTTVSGLDWGSSKGWYVVADNGNTQKQSSVWTFTVNYKPVQSLVSPADKATGLDTTVDLKKDVTDQDGDSVDVTYYWDDAANQADDTKIGTAEGVIAGDTATLTVDNLEYGTSYDWYTIADDGVTTSTSSTTTFQTSYQPDIPVLNGPTDGASNLPNDVTLDVQVSDPDGESLDTTFYWQNGTEIATETDVPSGSSASTTVSGLDWGATYNWYVEVNDGESTVSAGNYSFSTSNLPDKPVLEDPGDNVAGLDNEVTLETSVSEPDNDSMEVGFFWSNGSTIKTIQDVQSGETVSTTVSGLDWGTTYNWYAAATDSNGATSISTERTFTTQSAPSISPSVDIDESENTSLLTIDIDDKGENDISDYLGISDIASFDNSTLTKEVEIPYSAGITVLDFFDAQSNELQLDLDKTISSIGEKAGFAHTSNTQRIDKIGTITNNGNSPITYDFSMTPIEGTLVQGPDFSGTVSAGSGDNLAVISEGDWIINERNDTGLAVNKDKAQSFDEQHLLDGTIFYAENLQDFEFTGVDISGKCQGKTDATIVPGNNSIGCDTTQLSGDYLHNESAQEERWYDGTVAYGAGFAENYTAARPVHIDNEKNVSITLDGSQFTTEQNFCSFDDKDVEVRPLQDGISNITKSCVPGQEISYNVSESESGGVIDYSYNAEIQVFGEAPSTTEQEYWIPYNRFVGYNSIEQSTLELQVDGRHNGLSLSNIVTKNDTQYVKLIVPEDFGNSSLHSGQHTVSINYNTTSSERGGSPVSGGGDSGDSYEPVSLKFANTNKTIAPGTESTEFRFTARNTLAEDISFNVSEGTGRACEYMRVQDRISIYTNENGNRQFQYGDGWANNGSYELPSREFAAFENYYEKAIRLNIDSPTQDQLFFNNMSKTMHCQFDVEVSQGQAQELNFTYTWEQKDLQKRLEGVTEGIELIGSTKACLSLNALSGEECSETELREIKYPAMNPISLIIWLLGAYIVVAVGRRAHRKYWKGMPF